LCLKGINESAFSTRTSRTQSRRTPLRTTNRSTSRKRRATPARGARANEQRRSGPPTLVGDRKPAARVQQVGDPKALRDRRHCKTRDEYVVQRNWRHRLIESPALGLEVLKADDRTATLSYRTGNEIVQAVLDVSNDGLITRCRCGPSGNVTGKIDWGYMLGLAATLSMTLVAIGLLLSR
jgi:hypothetical protein